jgi:hypothetical protein
LGRLRTLPGFGSGRGTAESIRLTTSVEQCDECGFVYDHVTTGEVAGRLRGLPARYRQVMEGIPHAAARRRPEPAVWSALEYICHLRDVLLVQRDRAVLAQVEECPSVARMHRDERVDLCRYADHTVEEALDQLQMAADLCGMVFSAIPEAGWSRRLLYNWPQSAAVDLAWLGQHTIHEGEHHLQDVRRVLERITRS